MALFVIVTPWGIQVYAMTLMAVKNDESLHLGRNYVFPFHKVRMRSNLIHELTLIFHSEVKN